MPDWYSRAATASKIWLYTIAYITEQNEEEDKKTCNDSLPTGILLCINSQKNKHYSEICDITVFPPVKRPLQNPNNLPST
jgi:hypothetical protein